MTPKKELMITLQNSLKNNIDEWRESDKEIFNSQKGIVLVYGAKLDPLFPYFKEIRFCIERTHSIPIYVDYQVEKTWGLSYFDGKTLLKEYKKFRKIGAIKKENAFIKRIIDRFVGDNPISIAKHRMEVEGKK